MAVYAPGYGPGWHKQQPADSMRNGVAPDALGNALAACAALRRNDPALVRWIEDGAPTLTASEHRQRFGTDYAKRPRRAT